MDKLLERFLQYVSLDTQSKPGVRQVPSTEGQWKLLNLLKEQLDAMGLVRSSTGSGPLAGAIVISEPSSALAWALRMHVATTALPVRDLVQTRLLLEMQSAVDAAEAPDSDRRTDVLEQAARLLDLMDDPELPEQEFHAHDAQFHVLLVSLAGNMVVETIMSSLRQAMIGYVEEIMTGLDDWAEISRTLQEQHRAILRAVEERRGEDAAQSLKAHILWFYGLADAHKG